MSRPESGQRVESNRQTPRDRLTNTVAWAGARERGGEFGGDWSLYGARGERKYLNQQERQRVLRAVGKLPPERALFALVLAWTGARISEVLALTPHSFQLDSGVVAIVTLKRRKFAVREVPISPDLMRRLDRYFDLRRSQKGEHSAQFPLWRFCRQTGWRIIKEVMAAARVFGPQACPRGLRHSFGVCTLQCGVPLNLIQRWMGHARMTTTAIYAAVCGPEEIAFAEQFWRSPRDPSPIPQHGASPA